MFLQVFGPVQICSENLTFGCLWKRSEVSGKIAAIGNRFLNVAAKIILNQVLNQLTQEISPKNKKLSFLALLINFFGPRQ